MFLYSPIAQNGIWTLLFGIWTLLFGICYLLFGIWILFFGIPDLPPAFIGHSSIYKAIQFRERLPTLICLHIDVHIAGATQYGFGALVKDTDRIFSQKNRVGNMV